MDISCDYSSSSSSSDDKYYDDYDENELCNNPWDLDPERVENKAEETPKSESLDAVREKENPRIGSTECSALLGKYEKHWDGFSALRKRYGDAYGITVGTTKCAVVSSLDLMNTILMKNSTDFLNRPDFLRFHAIFRGNRGIYHFNCILRWALANGGFHRDYVQEAPLNQSDQMVEHQHVLFFISQQVLYYCSTIALCNWSNKQITRRNITNPFMHPDKRMQHYFLDQMALSIENEMDYMYMSGTRFDPQDPKFRQIVLNYDEILRELFMGYALDFMPWLKPFNMKKLNHLSELSQSVASLSEPLFKDHAKELNPSSPRDLIDLLLMNVSEKDSADTLTMEEAEVIFDDLIGGHSALGNLMLWAFYFIAYEQEVQKNIKEEVKFATRGNQKMPELSDREQLKYVEATILEVLRVVSSPLIPHAAVRDTLIGGYYVPKDTLILFNTYDINMDPELWDEPKKFDPSRRSCLGDRLVKSTMLVTIATIAQNFNVELSEKQSKPDYDDIPGIVIPREDIALSFKPIVLATAV
ncbi:Cytochrome P450 307a1 [Nymphon striatum]|nr:Cytochrome P450 307a1 [Nymphon striatum]